jgi:hypothetical protein
MFDEPLYLGNDVAVVAAKQAPVAGDRGFEQDAGDAQVE